MKKIHFLIFALIITGFSGCINNEKEIAVEPSSKYFSLEKWIISAGCDSTTT